MITQQPGLRSLPRSAALVQVSEFDPETGWGEPQELDLEVPAEDPPVRVSPWLITRQILEEAVEGVLYL